MRLKDQVAIVTGSGRGIGRSIAITFAKEGANVAIVARTESEIESAVNVKLKIHNYSAGNRRMLHNQWYNTYAARYSYGLKSAILTFFLTFSIPKTVPSGSFIKRYNGILTTSGMIVSIGALPLSD
jgi:hypothetical protein